MGCRGFSPPLCSDLDRRVLLAVTAACVALLGMEVLSTDWAIAWLVPIVARSIAMFTADDPVVRTVEEVRARDNGGR